MGNSDAASDAPAGTLPLLASGSAWGTPVEPVPEPAEEHPGSPPPSNANVNAAVNANEDARVDPNEDAKLNRALGYLTKEREVRQRSSAGSS